jgi:hypothetical protein
MQTNLYYNNNQILSGQPVPFVGKQESMLQYGERWADKSTITLHGQLTGCTYGELIDSQQRLLNSFAKDFQSFKIIETDLTDQTIFDKPYTFVRSINFPSAAYNNIVDYNVTLECYDEDLFSGVYGVVDPSDEWSIEETVDGFINVTHNISARGFNTTSGDSNAFENAKNFVLANTGLNPNIIPTFVATPSGFNPCLKSIAEKPNRFNATYAVTETYVADQYFGVDGVLRYTVNFDCNEEGVARLAVQGTIDGCGMIADVTSIRNRYETINFYGLAYDVYFGMTNNTGLNPVEVTRNFNEDPYARRLTFNVIYDNITGNEVYLDYGVSLDSGENNITVVTWNGAIKGRGDLRLRWDRVYAFYQTFDPFPTANDVYNEFSSGAWPLNIKPITKGTTFDKFNGQINLNYSWDNKLIPWAGFEDLDYSLNFIPATRKIIANPLLNLCALDYYIADAGYVKRAEFGIEGHGRLTCDLPPPEAQQLAMSSALYNANLALTQYFSTTGLLQEEVSFTKGLYDLSFRFKWSAEGPEFNV